MFVVVLLSACGGNSKSVVIAPTITEFTASSSSIAAGDEVTLNWVVEGTKPVNTSITSLGDVTGSSATVSPAETTTYTLTAGNSAGKVTKDLVVTVIPKIVELAIKNVDSVITNYHPTFIENSARISLYVDFTKEIQATDIQSIEITAALATNRSWLVENSEFFENNLYTFDDGSTGIALENIFTDVLSTNSSVIYLGDYLVVVTLKDSKTLSYTHTVPAPNSNATNGKKYGYTENYVNSSNPLPDYVSLLKRAQIKSAALDDTASRLTVSFSISDPRVYNGTIWIYDRENNFIGGLKSFFRNTETGEVSSSLNAGTVFKTGGALNTVTLEAPQVSFVEGKSFKDIDNIHVVLYDGRQYKGTDTASAIDNRSISAVKFVDSGPSQ